MKLFNAVERKIGRQNIIAEDLGYLTDSVKKLLEDSSFPGMKVMEFAFDSRDASGNEYLPHNYVKNCVAYAGTHDNDTIMGWFEDAEEEDVIYAKEYMNISEGDSLNWSMMNTLWGSVADLTIVQGQDLLGLGSEARMNEPSTVGKNWQWRTLPDTFTEELAKKLKRKMKVYGRLNE
jgi:4-alpha-glucanotransferase